MEVTRIRSRILVATATVVALLAAGCTGEWPQGFPGPAPQEDGQIAWEPCPELLDDLLGDVAPPGLVDQLAAQVEYHCGTVPVPRDWDNPDSSGTFEISLVRARSVEQQDRIGSLLVNPGGPGASGIESAVFLSFGPLVGGLPERITGRFDLVGFDPRGVGRSSPVECFTDAQLDESFGGDPDPVQRDEFDTVLAQTRAQAQECGEEYGDTLHYYSTRQTAHDLDALREAVGDEQLTYLGFSYGTLLGAVYAHLYPDNIRAMVLDGAIDPEQGLIESSQEQARGFEQALDTFDAWCAESADTCGLQPDARTAVTDALADAEESPVSGEGDREATAGWVFWAVVSSLYSQELWPQLATALEQLDGGDPAGVFELADAYASRGPDGSYTNMFDANNAINCADAESNVSVDRVRDLQEQWRKEYPVFGAPMALGVLGCTLWPAEPDPYPTGPAEGAPPILVVGTEGDPATPYEATGRLADLLGVGVVVTSEGEGHTAYPENQCISEVVDPYLIDGTVPDEGTTCPG